MSMDDKKNEPRGKESKENIQQRRITYRKEGKQETVFVEVYLNKCLRILD